MTSALLLCKNAVNFEFTYRKELCQEGHKFKYHIFALSFHNQLRFQASKINIMTSENAILDKTYNPEVRGISQGARGQPRGSGGQCFIYL